MTTAEIITIGDELLIGQVVDTNSAWIGQQLNEAGIRIRQKIAIGDDENLILDTLKQSSQQANLILITGGLGPTKDDITKLALCKYFKSNLRFEESVFQYIEQIFKARGRAVTEVNRKQAEVPEKCTVIPNSQGTAPGMWFEKDKVVYVSMPGVPHEMKTMMEKSVLPMLKKKFSETNEFILHRTIMLQGIGESFLSDMLDGWETSLPQNLKLAYLPATGLLRLRLTGTGNNEKSLRELMDNELKKLNDLAAEYIYGFENESLEGAVGKLLTEKGLTLSTAESCTGGYIAHRITTVPGSSVYYKGSVVAYANEIKEKFLEIERRLIEDQGAVSEAVAKAMALSVQKQFATDYSIACSGIAGPGGGTENKPVGTVWIAIASPGDVKTWKLQLGSSRERVIMETSQHALSRLRKTILSS